jgi:hypothetical protein
MPDNDLDEWLQSLPLDEAVTIDEELVYLRVRENGAELGGYFLHSCTEEQLQAALKMGFESALEFGAGWSISTEEDALLLTQWLPQVSTWAEAAEPLENRLNQIGALRAALTPAKPKYDDIQHRNEQRVRMLFAGGAR